MSKEYEVEDVDRDSLHVLPLSIIPLRTLGLKRTRLIKNAHLQSVIEIFIDKRTGSGQLEIDELAKEFNWDVTDPPADLIMMRKLGTLPSYDVYSLRISLRELGIDIENVDDLKLSESKNRELTTYMTSFTRPLIQHIYGSDEMEIESFQDVVKLFRDPDVKKALSKIQEMSEMLGIKPDEIPTFMEDYGDIFLSLSYYRQCLDSIEPTITEFLEAMQELSQNYQFKTDQNLMQTVRHIEATINEHMAAVTGCFENFERGTLHMWDEITAERFRKVEKQISSYHLSIGGILCALSVKMDAWSRMFPNKNSGGPVRRAEFIMSEMKQGIDNIIKIDDEAPMLTAR